MESRKRTARTAGARASVKSTPGPALSWRRSCADAERSSLYGADAAQVAAVHAGGGADRRARHRREHRDLQRRQRRDAAAAAVRKPGPPGLDRREERHTESADVCGIAVELPVVERAVADVV